MARLWGAWGVTLLGLGLAAHAATIAVQASWYPNSEPDLGGYRLYWGTTSRGSATQPSQFSYASHQDVGVSATPSATVSGLDDGTTYYFALTASDTNGNESAFSAEAIFGPGREFTAYNDLAWFSPQASLNITILTTTNGFADGTPVGQLLDHGSGAQLPVTVTVTGGSGVSGDQGLNAAAGTDASGVFSGKVDCAGTISYGSDDLVLAFDGLDPAFEYELVVYSDRNGATYTGAGSRYHYATLSGADAYQNASSPEATKLSDPDPNDTTRYNAGYNHPYGYVTRFKKIDPGTDRAVTLTIKRDVGQQYYTYANAFMLKATTGRPIIVDQAAAWRYRRGTAEASVPATAWRMRDFDDSGWTPGNAPFGYSSETAEGPFGTTLTDMQGSYSSVFLRRTFVVENPPYLTELALWAEIDDAFVMWINGEEIARTNMPGGAGTFHAYNAFSAGGGEPVTWTQTLRGDGIPALVPGTNILAVQAFNATLGSSDLKIDVKLTAAEAELPFAMDGDGNGMADTWETRYFQATGQSGTDDDDGDGLSNLDEFICGSNPTNGGSVFDVALNIGPSGLRVSFVALEASGSDYTGYDRHYALQERTDLHADAWKAVAGYADIVGAGQTVIYTNTAPAGLTFYRGRVWLE
ncbi:MAG: hypothetical protein JXR37_11125 [Kiritimatiellae bacterium]|nr:hypothetical protein [Kiritimatiellia bacterium]